MVWHRKFSFPPYMVGVLLYLWEKKRQYISQPLTGTIKLCKLHFSGYQWNWLFLCSKPLVIVDAKKASLQIWSKREDEEGVRDSTVAVGEGTLGTSCGILAPAPVLWWSSLLPLNGFRDRAAYFRPLRHYVPLLIRGSSWQSAMRHSTVCRFSEAHWGRHTFTFGISKFRNTCW